MHVDMYEEFDERPDEPLDHDVGKELMKDLLFAIYEDGDLETIYSSLEDLSGFFGVEMPAHLPSIREKND